MDKQITTKKFHRLYTVLSDGSKRYYSEALPIRHIETLKKDKSLKKTAEKHALLVEDVEVEKGTICDNLFHTGQSCSELYDCCDCGGNDCGCAYCFSCNACEYCLLE